jgi:S-methylmethionine-dependent homocysteine/selenocysteine methylase
MTAMPGPAYARLRERLMGGEVLLLDGGIGTEMLRRGLTWEGHKVDTAADVIRTIHADYLAAGADVITTNTFQLARRSFLNHFRDLDHLRRVGAEGLEGRAAHLIRQAVARAKEAVAASGREGTAAIAGSMTTLEWCFRPDLAPPVEAARAEYRETIGWFAEAGVDLILFETMNRIAEAAAALEAAREVGLPAWVSFVPHWDGTLLGGEPIAEAAAALEPLGPDLVLFNCAPPADVTLALRELVAHRRGPSGVYPHVGRFDPPDWQFTDEYPPARYLECAREWLALGARVIGGCCGTTPDHIRALAAGLPRRRPGVGARPPAGREESS